MIDRNINKEIKRYSLIAAIVALVIAVASICIVFSTDSASALVFTSDYFTYINATSEDGASVNGNEKGLMIRGFEPNAVAETIATRSGKTDIGFAFAEGASGISMYIDDIVNTENRFAINLLREGEYLSASVTAFGERAGITYNNGVLPSGKTSADNTNGIYTTVEYVPSANRIVFDPDDMTVSLADGNTVRKVWDLFLKTNDGREIGATLDKIHRYKVRIVFEYGAGGILIYDWNGQRFDTPILSGGGINTAGAEIFADFVRIGFVGLEYRLPTPTAYDVMDGKIEDINVAVIFNNKYLLPEREFTGGIAFTPAAEGSYTVRYTAVDAYGIKTVKDYCLDVVSAVEEKSRVSFSKAVIPEKIGTASEVAVPIGTVYLSNAVRKERAFAMALTVKHNGVTVDGYDGIYVGGGAKFRFAEAGEYTFMYRAANEEIDTAETKTVTVADDLPAIVGLDISGEYRFGEKAVFDVPVFIADGQTSSATTVTVKYPSGKAYRSNVNILDEYGLYTVTYSAVFGTKVYLYDCYFSVTKPLYSCTDGYAAYGKTSYLSTSEGIAVTLNGKSEFVYNNVVDLSDNTKEDCLLRLYFTPETVGELEASGVEVKITDLHDENNYIVINTKREVGSPTLSYVRAGATSIGQIPSGWFGSSPNNPYGKQYVGGDYGRVVNLSPSGVVRGGKTEIDPFEIYFDNAERQIHIGDTGVAGWENRLVADLDNPDEFSTLWGGFSNGEVIISIKAYALNASKFSFFVTDIDGQSLAATGLDKNAPKINIDLNGYEENDLPIAEVGKPYSVFDAWAFDADDGAVEVSVCAVMRDSKGGEYILDIADGKFIPFIDGNYYLRYTAQNSAGVVTVKNLAIAAYRNTAKPSIDVENAASCNAGEYIEVPTPTVTGGSGKAAVVIEYAAPSGEHGIIDGRLFRPLEIGTYSLKYRATDYLGYVAEKTVELISHSASEPVIYSEPKFPSALIQGEAYALPDLYIIDRSGGEAVRKKAEVTVKYGATDIAVTDGKIVPTVENSGDIIDIVYSYGTWSKTYSLPVMQIKIDGKFYAVNHFARDNMEITATARVNGEGEHSVILRSQSNEARAEWLLPLVAGKFQTVFDVLDGEATEKIDIVLTDSVDTDISVKFTILKTSQGQKSRLQINGGASFRIDGSFFPPPDNASATFVTQFTIGYDALRKTVNDGASARVAIDRTESGEAFDGFPSGYVKLSYTIYGENGAISLKSINGQRMSAETSDGGASDIYLIEGEKRTYAQGDEIALPMAYASDVLDSELSYFAVTVNAPDGKPVKAMDGTLLNNAPMRADYMIKLDKTGGYTLIYTSADGSGNVDPYTYTIRVRDTDPPVIVLSADSIKNVKLGDTVTVPSATVEGGVSDEAYIYVINPYGLVRKIDGNSYSDTTVRGNYTVRYVAFDAYGNMSVRELSFTVN